MYLLESSAYEEPLKTKELKRDEKLISAKGSYASEAECRV